MAAKVAAKLANIERKKAEKIVDDYGSEVKNRRDRDCLEGMEAPGLGLRAEGSGRHLFHACRSHLFLYSPLFFRSSSSRGSPDLPRFEAVNFKLQRKSISPKK